MRISRTSEEERKFKLTASTVTIKTAEENNFSRISARFFTAGQKHRIISAPGAFLLFSHRGDGVIDFLKELECSERWDEQSVFVEMLIPRPALSAKMCVLLYVWDFNA